MMKSIPDLEDLVQSFSSCASADDIASMLGLHRRTVEDHLTAARQRRAAETTMQAVAVAIRRRLI